MCACVCVSAGVSNLARRLNAILVEHIRGLLPGLRRRIDETLEVRHAVTNAYGQGLL
jgi:dynamin 1-like protein